MIGARPRRLRRGKGGQRLGSRPRIAVVEDDAAIAAVLGMHLRAAGYEVRGYPDGPSFLRDAPACWPDLVVLDVLLPGPDGFEVLERLRREMDVPVLMLTALGETRLKVRGFRLGADDYVVKPFEPEEVQARVRALLRRAGHRVAESARVEGLVVDRLDCAARVSGERVPLSGREVSLLLVLAQSPNRSFTRGQLLDLVWGPEADVEERVVDAYVTRLRRKLTEAWAGPEPPPWRLETVWGVGYKLAVRPPDP